MNDGVKSAEEVAREYVTWATSNVPRIPTGYPLVDDRTNGGIAQGEVMFFVARPSVGKTAWALNVINHNPTTPALMFSVEMHGRYIMSRLAAISQRSTTQEIERAMRLHGHSPVLDAGVRRFDRLAIMDRPSLSVADMLEATNEATERLGTRPLLVVIDYLELISGGLTSGAAEAIDKVAVDLKVYARTADVALVVLHQVSREQGANGEVPLGLRSGKYGGEAAADYFVAAFRPALDPRLTVEEYEEKQPQWYMQFLKNRANGMIHPQGALHWFDPNTMVISTHPPGQQRMEVAQ